jgi:MMPL family
MSIGRWSIRHPRKAVAAWVAFAAAAIALGAISGTKTLDNGAVGESARGYTIMNEYRLWGPGRELAYIHAPRSPVPRSALRDVERRLRALGLTPERKVSADGRSAVVAVELTRQVGLERIRAAVAAAARAHPGLTIEETGDASADQARDRTVNRDLHRAELLSIPVTLLVLLFAFGSLTAALVPVLLALSAVAAGLGLLGPLSQLFPVEDSAKTVVLLIGMAVGVDYALFFVVRSRAERHRGAGIEEALETTLRTSGRTVVRATLDRAHRRRRHRRRRGDGLRLRPVRDALVARAQAGGRGPRRGRSHRRDGDPRAAPARDDEAARRPELVPAAVAGVAAALRARRAVGGSRGAAGSCFGVVPTRIPAAAPLRSGSIRCAGLRGRSFAAFCRRRRGRAQAKLRYLFHLRDHSFSGSSSAPT